MPGIRMPSVRRADRKGNFRRNSASSPLSQLRLQRRSPRFTGHRPRSMEDEIPGLGDEIPGLGDEIPVSGEGAALLSARVRALPDLLTGSVSDMFGYRGGVMAQKILVVDDEVQIVRVVRGYLEKSGYRVVTATNGRDALFVARDEKPDLVILDLQMPEMDGLEFTRIVKSELPNLAIIILTARVEEMDRILGLELGADDYVTKPFSPRELVARVRAVLRRVQTGPAPAEVLEARGVVLDQGRREVRKDSVLIDLTPTEFDLLAVLMSAPGRAFSRADLLEATQGVTFEAYERTIDAHIKNLRQKIEEDPAKPAYVGTVRGVGYRFID